MSFYRLCYAYANESTDTHLVFSPFGTIMYSLYHVLLWSLTISWKSFSISSHGTLLKVTWKFIINRDYDELGFFCNYTQYCRKYCTNISVNFIQISFVPTRWIIFEPELLVQREYRIIIWVNSLSLVAQQYRIRLPVQEMQVQSWVRKIPCRNKWQPTPVLLPGKSHGQRNLVGYCSRGRKESDTT